MEHARTRIPGRLAAPSPGWTARADVIVVGSGVAGLTTALRVRALGLSVLLVTKATVNEGSTRWAQVGSRPLLRMMIHLPSTCGTPSKRVEGCVMNGLSTSW